MSSFRRRETVLPYGRQSIDEDDIAAVTAQLRDDWLTQGPTVARFETAIAELTGARYAVAVANGTAALHLACLAAGVGPGDTGVTSTITFVASANAIRYAGGTPHLIDVEPHTALLSLTALEASLAALKARGTPPRVIIPVDMAGAMPDLAAVRTLADRVGACVIEDAAHALGATYLHAGQSFRAASCKHTDMAILSFHPVKHLTTGEGGAITTNDAGLYRTLCDLRTHGITKDPERLIRNEGPWYYEQHVLGYNYRLTDLQCALGLSQIRKFGGFLAQRRALANHYDVALEATDLRAHLAPLRVPPGVSSAYHLYVVRVLPRPGEDLASVSSRRRDLFIRLRELNIAPQVHYIPVHRQPDYAKNGLGHGLFPGADAYYAACLSLPLFPSMTIHDADYVIAALRRVLGLT